jgi:hypothetical protein
MNQKIALLDRFSRVSPIDNASFIHVILMYLESFHVCFAIVRCTSLNVQATTITILTAMETLERIVPDVH